MDHRSFDALARSFAEPKTRRGLLGTLAALGAGLLGAQSSDALVTQAQCGNQTCASNPGGCKPGCVCCVYTNAQGKVTNSRCRPPGTCSPGAQVGGATTPPPTTTRRPTTTTTARPTTTTARPTTTSTTTQAPPDPTPGTWSDWSGCQCPAGIQTRFCTPGPNGEPCESGPTERPCDCPTTTQEPTTTSTTTSTTSTTTTSTTTTSTTTTQEPTTTTTTTAVPRRDECTPTAVLLPDSGPQAPPGMTLFGNQSTNPCGLPLRYFWSCQAIIQKPCDDMTIATGGLQGGDVSVYDYPISGEDDINIGLKVCAFEGPHAYCSNLVTKFYPVGPSSIIT